MAPPLTFGGALGVWGISRVGDVYSAPPAAPCLLDQSPETIRKRYRELAARHPDKRAQSASAAAAAAGISSGSSSSGEEEEGEKVADFDWLRKARDLLLEKLQAEQDKDRQRLAAVRQHQLDAAANFLQQLAERGQECRKQWRQPAAALQLYFAHVKRQVGQSQYGYLGVTLSSSTAQNSTTALVTKHGYMLDRPFDQADHLPGLAFAHEVLSLQQACKEHGWRMQQARDGSLRISCSRRSATVTAQQLADGTATVAVRQVLLSAQPDSPRQAAGAASTAGTAGTAGSAPPPATKARHDRGPSSARPQPTPAAAGPSHARVLPVAQRMMQAAAAAAAAAAAVTPSAERELLKEVRVGSAFLSKTNFNLSRQDVPKLLREEWDGKETVLSAEDMHGRRYSLSVKQYDETLKQQYKRRRSRCYFPRALMDDNQVREGQRMLMWRVPGGGLQLQFKDGPPAAEPSGSGSGSTAQQHSTGRKRAAPE